MNGSENFYFIYFQPHRVAYGISVPRQGVGRLTRPAVDMESSARGPPGCPSFQLGQWFSPGSPGLRLTLPVHGGMKSICAQELEPHGLGGTTKTKSK